MRHVENIVMALLGMALGISWLAGFALAKGFWSTTSCIIPFYAWYLVIEKIMKLTGFA